MKLLLIMHFEGDTQQHTSVKLDVVEAHAMVYIEVELSIHVARILMRVGHVDHKGLHQF